MSSLRKHCHKVILVSLLFLSTCSTHERSLPILLLATESAFGTYTGEILHAEGFNEFILKSVYEKSVDLSLLKSYDVVILAQNEIGADKSEMLRRFVGSGGNLIAFKPDTELFDVFGIKNSEGKISEGYIAIDTLSETGQGLTNKTIRLHVKAVKYNLTTGKIIASLCEDSRNLTRYPALISSTYGSGYTYAFSYNLPESVVYTRQGNPVSAGRETDGINGIRAMDLFTGGWVDTSKNIINQADIQMSLLSHCIEEICNEIKPIPRLWYFPESLKCLVTLTNDGEYRSEEDFEPQFTDMDSLNAKMTLYILEPDKVSKDWTKKWISRGFEISGHPDDTWEAGDPQWINMYNALENKRKEISDIYGIKMKTVVNHWFVWCGKDSAGSPEFAAQAMIEADQGLRMDINYAHYDNGSVEGHFLGPTGLSQGNFTGSGLVMKFADSKGNILDIYQHVNNVYDQQYNELDDPNGFFECFKGLMDRSLNNEVYSCISIKSHNDEYYFSRSPLQKMIDYTGSKGIPIWTAATLTDFITARDNTSFEDINWNGKELSFMLQSPLVHESDLTIMIPVQFQNMKINQIMMDSDDCNYEERKFKGRIYAFFDVTPGHSYSIKVNYND